MIFMNFGRNQVFDPVFLKNESFIFILTGWNINFMDNPNRKYRSEVPEYLFFLYEKKMI